jgi:excisionase family DNA binding protein
MSRARKSPPHKSTLPPSRSPPIGNRPVSESDRRAYRINEYCDSYRVSRQTVYDLMNAGLLSYFHVGKERRIPVEAAEAYAQQQSAK